jgi:hypothetical protein
MGHGRTDWNITEANRMWENYPTYQWVTKEKEWVTVTHDHDIMLSWQSAIRRLGEGVGAMGALSSSSSISDSLTDLFSELLLESERLEDFLGCVDVANGVAISALGVSLGLTVWGLFAQSLLQAPLYQILYNVAWLKKAAGFAVYKLVSFLILG